MKVCDYRIEIEKEGDWYVARCTIPVGAKTKCLVAQGKTASEAERIMLLVIYTQKGEEIYVPQM